ncbi:Fe(III) reductase, alpha subunit [Leptospirillum ferriphilum]|jgi:predicted molibdopterin-dependent oxidoreductase YjgC|uniref:Fe(III) reductase, alpha subunit n=3 Tax=Leptospirillum TaxID=179 RepID=A0A094X3H8_9BACT|nr:molybdopterin-dependent oxidoreductase [Leptospirillum ferriphilum]EDZ38536.1 MAG: NADH dehydrogenase (quinone), chain G [Leptospirillum sp. Group II '5-way CG']KGA93119.1 Fe(III) reductase, alpha subunit [Leptospirillum ferriphilum]
MAKVTVNGIEVDVDPSYTILKAAEKAGISIPTFCYHPRMDPAGSCRICAVELEDSKRVVMSCVTPVSDGMKVLTESPKIHDARKTNLELLLLHHPLDCPVCDCGGECPLQNMSFAYGATESRFESHRNDEPEDLKSDVLVFNANRCILCGKCVRICDEIQDVHAIGFINRGFDTIIGPPLGKKLDCEFCGDCLEVCPTGAITDHFVRYKFRPWQLEQHQTTCTNCASGCQMHVETENESIVRVTSKEGLGPNEGSICVVGRFGFNHVQTPQRFDTPYMRVEHRLVPASWEELLPELGNRLNAIRRKGTDRVAGLISPRVSLEDAYAFQSFFRKVLKSNMIDTGARYGFMNAALPIVEATGTLRPLVDHEDLLKAKVILLIGTDPVAESNITGLFLKRAARKNRARLYVVDSEAITLSNRASDHIRVNPGGESLFVSVLSEEIVSGGNLTSEWLTRKEELFKNWNVDPGAYQRLVHDLKTAETGVLVTGRKMFRNEKANQSIKNMMKMIGSLGWMEREGCGILPIPETANDLGVLMMGATFEWLPGLLDARNESSRKKWESAWGTSLSYGSGGGLGQILQGIEEGKINALITIGENPIGHFPSGSKVRQILGKLDLIVSLDMFQNELVDMAHFVLPASSSFERVGHFVSVEGFVQKSVQTMAHWGESLPDWEILEKISHAMGSPMGFDSAESVMQEILRFLPDLSPSTRNGEHFVGKTGDIHLVNPLSPSSLLPNVEEKVNGSVSRRKIAEVPAHKANRSSVSARFASWNEKDKPVLCESGLIPGEGEFIFSMTKSLFHSGKMTLQDPNLKKIQSEGKLRINRQTARKRKIKKGEKITLSSAYGRCSFIVEPSPMVSEFELLFPEHFADSQVLALFPPEIALSPETGTPTTRRIRVSLSNETVS